MKKMILSAIAAIGCIAITAAEIPMKLNPIRDPETKTINTTIAPDGVITVDNKTGKSGGVSCQVNINQTAPAKIVLSGESICLESVTKSRQAHDYSLYIDLTYMDGIKKYGHITTFSPDVKEWQKKAVEFMPEKAVKQLRIYILYRFQTGKVQFKNLKLEEFPAENK